MKKNNNSRKGNRFFSLKFCFLFLIFLFLFVIPINAENFGYGDAGQGFGYNSVVASSSTGGNTTIFNNNTYINQTTNITNNITNNITQQAPNYSILSFKANITDFPTLLSQFINDLGIGNWTLDKSSYFTKSDIYGLNFYNSSNFNISSFYNSSNPLNFINTSNSLFSYFTNSTFYLNSNPLNFINTSNSLFNYFTNSTFALRSDLYSYIYNGTLCQSNGTGCPASTGLTNGSSAWLNSLAIGTTNFNLFDASNPAILSINSSNSKEGINLEGNINDFFEANIANINMGNASQACWTSTTNAENLTFNFISMCANNGNFSNQTSYNVGFGNDTSLMGLGLGDMYIDQAQPNKDLYFMNGGTNASNLSQIFMMVNGSNNNFVGINTTNPQNTLNVVGDINGTGNLFVGNTLTNFFTINSTAKSFKIGDTGFATTFPTIILNGSSLTGGQALVINLTGANSLSESALTTSVTPDGANSARLFGNFWAGNRTSSFRGVGSYISTFNLNNTGITSQSLVITAANASITAIQFGTLINLTSSGAVALPPFTGAGVAVCSNSTNPTFAGTMMKNTTGVYGCPVAGGNWLKLF